MLKKGEVLTNRELTARFRTQNQGGIRVSNHSSAVIVIVDYDEKAEGSIYRDYWEGDTLYYRGQGDIGNQTLKHFNGSLAKASEDNRSIFLFERLGKDRFRFEGFFELSASPYQTEEPDRLGHNRLVWVFPLKRSKIKNKDWAEQELVLALNLYWNLGAAGLSKEKSEVRNLADILGRSPGSVALKLSNFASLDPDYLRTGRKGMPNRGRLDEEVWRRYYKRWDALFEDGEKAMQELLGLDSYARLAGFDKDAMPSGEVALNLGNLPEEGLTVERIVRARRGQNRFREHILRNYGNSCCVTGLSETGLLVASHIVPWKDDVKNRMNPENGLCLNALHDKAFDCHYITISADSYRLIVSKRFKYAKSEIMKQQFLSLTNQAITLPERFPPAIEFLRQHNERFWSAERKLGGFGEI